jgi:hypothetical protein
MAKKVPNQVSVWHIVFDTSKRLKSVGDAVAALNRMGFEIRELPENGERNMNSSHWRYSLHHSSPAAMTLFMIAHTDLVNTFKITWENVYND